MTGYGRAEGSVAGRPLAVEIKSLNGKGFELNMRLPALLRPFDLDVRSLLTGLLTRGTLDIAVTLGAEGGSATVGAKAPSVINLDVAEEYFRQMQALSHRVGIGVDGHTIAAILRLPDVMTTDVAPEAVPESAWEVLRDTVTAAAAALTAHRTTEGAALERDLRARIAAITAALEAVAPLEEARAVRIRERIAGLLREHVPAEVVDSNRFEQEMIYYLERADFSEEKTRLAQHCTYFLSLLDEGGVATKGKRLSFVLQEIGREINTLGSKASDADIQRVVVGMKDELEKCKEQVLNVL